MKTGKEGDENNSKDSDDFKKLREIKRRKQSDACELLRYIKRQKQTDVTVPLTNFN